MIALYIHFLWLVFSISWFLTINLILRPIFEKGTDNINIYFKAPILQQPPPKPSQTIYLPPSLRQSNNNNLTNRAIWDFPFPSNFFDIMENPFNFAINKGNRYQITILIPVIPNCPKENPKEEEVQISNLIAASTQKSRKPKLLPPVCNPSTVRYLLTSWEHDYTRKEHVQ